jgi:hypothetical protein
MKIGDPVLHQGRRYVLRGLDPMSVPNQRAVVEDAQTGEETTVPIAELEPCPPNGRCEAGRV